MLASQSVKKPPTEEEKIPSLPQCADQQDIKMSEADSVGNDQEALKPNEESKQSKKKQSSPKKKPVQEAVHEKVTHLK